MSSSVPLCPRETAFPWLTLGSGMMGSLDMGTSGLIDLARLPSHSLYALAHLRSTLSPRSDGVRFANFPLIVAYCCSQFLLLSTCLSTRAYVPSAEPWGTGLLWAQSSWVPRGPPQTVPLTLSQAEPSGAGPLGLPHALAGLDHGLGGHHLRLLLP